MKHLFVLVTFLSIGMASAQYQNDQSLESQLKVIESRFIDRSVVFEGIEKYVVNYRNSNRLR